MIGRIFFWGGLAIANLAVIGVLDLPLVGVWSFFVRLLQLRLLVAAVGSLILFLPLAFLWPRAKAKLGLDLGKPWPPRILLAGALMANLFWVTLGPR